MKDQAVEIRRFIVASLDSFATRIVSDVRNSIPAPTLEFPAPPVPAPRPAWPWIAGIVAASLIAVAFAAGWVATRNELAKSRDGSRRLEIDECRIAARPDGICRARSKISPPRWRLRPPARPPPGAAGTPPFAPRIEPVPYGEIPFDRSRLDALRELLAKLEAQGFHGVVKITSSAGLFCLSGNATDGYAPAGAGCSSASAI